MKQNSFFLHALHALFLLLLVRCPVAAEGPCKAEEKRDADGGKVLELENDYLGLTIRPGAGGTVVSMMHKRTGLNYVGRTAGWFMDLDYSIPRQSNNDYQTQGYVFEIAENTPDRVSVTLKGKSKIPPLDWIEVRKTIALKKDSSAIHTSYRYSNHPDSMEPITVKPWIHHEICGLGADVRYVMPLTTGRYEIRPTAARPSSKYGGNPAQGWLGLFGPGENGLVAFPSFRDLHQYYEWVSTEVGTLEWRLRPLEITNGEAFETSYLMLPFAGLRDLSGGAQGIVCGLVLPDNIEEGTPVSWELELVSGQAEPRLTVEARVRHLAEGVWRMLGEQKCKLEADTPVKLQFGAWTPDRSGTWVLQARVSRSGKKLFDAERTVVLAKATEGYCLPLEGPWQESHNLVQDPSAEWGGEAGGNWIGLPQDKVCHSGRCSIKATGVAKDEVGTAVSHTHIPVEPETAYVISFWLRCPGSQPLRLRVVSIDETGKETAGGEAQLALELKETSSEWRRYETPFQTSPGAKFIDLRVCHPGDEVEFWLDDLSVLPGAPRTAVRPAQTDIPYTLEVTTPHVPWARPYSRGPIKAFLLTHVQSARDIAELAQRLEMDFTTVTVTGSSVHAPYASGTMGGRRMGDELRNIQEKLATRYEVIVLGGISWKWLTPKIRVALLRQVAAGAGLVYVQPNWLLDDLVDPANFDDAKLPKELREVDSQFPLKWPGEGRYRHLRDAPIPYRAESHPITDGIPFNVLVPSRYGNWGVSGEAVAMYNQNHPMVALGHYGKGKVVAMNFASGTWPYRKDAFESGKQFQLCGLFPFYGYDEQAAYKYHYWEYHWALVARTVAWAAGKAPEVAVVSVVPDAGVQNRPQGPVKTVSVQFQAEKATSGTLKVTFLDETSIPLATADQKVELAPGAPATFEFPTPDNSPAGLIFAEFILRGGEGRSLNWAATAYENPKPARIEALEVDRESKVYHKGETVTAKIKLSAKLDAAKLVAQAVDTHGRILLTKTVGAPEQEVSISFVLSHPRSVRAGIRAALFQGDRLIDRAEARFTVAPEQSPWDQYQFVVSGVRASRPHLYDAIYELYSDLGFTCVRGYHDPLMNADHGFNYLASCPGFGHVRGEAHTAWSRYLESGDLKYLHRTPPAYDEKKWQGLEKSLEEYYASRGAQFVPLIYGLSDENNIGGGECDFDYSPATLEWFRKWLEERYGTLVTLNAQWETDFGTWEEIVPMPLPVARKRGENLSPWADHREFMDHVFTQFHARLKAAIRRGDPNAIVGVSGTQHPDAYNGYDWWQLMKVFDALLAYTRGNQPEIQRSFKRVPSIGWAGYGCRGPRVSAQLWDFLLYNKQAALWRDLLVIEPDWRVSQSGRDYADAVKPLLKGLGKLIIQSEWVPSPIGIHYSQASIRAAAGTKRGSAFERARAAWVALLKDLGLQPVFVSYEQVERGELDPGRIQAFVLPESEAISQAEEEQLRKYVDSGGLLIADTQLALRDEHCRLLPQARLDDLFGFQRAETDQERPPRFIDFQDADWIKWPSKRLILSLADGAAAISPTAAKPLASSRGVPAFICRSVGKGRTVYLNFHLTSYAGASEEGAKFRDNLRALLEAAGLGFPSGVLDEDGKPFYGAEVTVFRNGSEPLISLLANFGQFQAQGWETRPVEMRFKGKGWVYEVVTGEAYGHTDRIRCELPGSAMRLFALLPGEVRNLTVDGPGRAKPGEVLSFGLKVDAQPPLRDRQLVRIEVTGPDRELRRAYSTNAWLPAKGGPHDIPLALNDTPGTWRLRVTHVTTGTSAEAAFELTPAEEQLRSSVWR